MAKCEDLSNKRYGRLIVKYRYKNIVPVKWVCLCDCGNLTTVLAGALKRGNTKSCGCWHRENQSLMMSNNKIAIKHNLHKTKEYRAWKSIKERIFNKNSEPYKNYGGRGILMYEDWIENPEEFIKYVRTLDNYDKYGYSIDRINNNGYYEPGNLKWSTSKEQNQNRRSSKVTKEIAKSVRELKDKLSIKELMLLFNLSDSTIYRILNNQIWKEDE